MAGSGPRLRLLGAGQALLTAVCPLRAAQLWPGLAGGATEGLLSPTSLVGLKQPVMVGQGLGLLVGTRSATPDHHDAVMMT